MHRSIENRAKSGRIVISVISLDISDSLFEEEKADIVISATKQRKPELVISADITISVSGESKQDIDRG